MIGLVLFAVALMALQDVLGVFMVVAESKGRGWIAGIFDGLGDWPKMYGAGISGAMVTQRGFGPEFVLCSFVSLTSMFTTRWATNAARGMKAED